MKQGTPQTMNQIVGPTHVTASSQSSILLEPSPFNDIGTIKIQPSLLKPFVLL